MKLFNRCIATLFLCSIFTFSANAQTKTFIQEVGGLWGAGGHWSPPGVPTAQDDVIIPSDTALDVNVNAQCRSIIVEADAEMDIEDVTMIINQNSTFEAGSTIDWVAGTIITNGILTVQGQLNVTSNLTKTLAGNTLRIESEMNIVDAVNNIRLSNGAKLQIASDGALNLEGEIDFLNVAFQPGVIENQGTINRNSGAGTIMCDVRYVQDGGTFNLDFGSMIVTGGSTLSGGVLNVNAGGFFEFGGNTSHYMNGNITGQLDGPLILNSGATTLPEGDAILNFSGPAGVEFSGGGLAAQGSAGTAFVNMGLFTIKNIGSTQQPFMGSASIFRNQGLLLFDASVDGFVLNQFSTIENLNDGIVIIEDDTDILVNQGSFLNSGLIQKTGGAGVINFVSLTNNSDGIFDIASGGINFSSTFEGKGIITGTGSFQTDTLDEIESTIAPGNDGPGTLTFINVALFEPTEDCVYQFELNGTTPDTEHDVFVINAPAQLEGTFDIQLGFAPQLNDEFVVIMANSVTQCNLPAQVSADFNGMTYIYDVVCNTDNVTLKVVNISLGVGDIFGDFISQAYPNPTNGQFTIDLNRNYDMISVSVYNYLGQNILNRTDTNTDRVKLELNENAGLYFVELMTSNGASKTMKVIKK